MNISTRMVKAPHEVRDERKLALIVASMVSDGWTGRAVLAVYDDWDYQAWTGSHRLAAAVAAGLDEVPVVQVPVALLTEIRTTMPTVVRGIELVDGDALREIATLARALGYSDVADLCEAE